jgi:hypothetical protein
MKAFFGPWSTELYAGSRLSLSAFWKRRMIRLASIRRSRPELWGWKLLCLAVGCLLLCAVPTVQLTPALAEPAGQNPADPPNQELAQVTNTEAVESRPSATSDSAENNEAEDEENIDKALAELQRHYALEDAEVLKRVPPPFPPSRLVLYRHWNPSQAEAIPRGPDVTYFRWELGQLTSWGMTFGKGGSTIRTVLRMVASVYPQEIEGDPELLETAIEGDWVFLKDAELEKVLADLENIVRSDLKWSARITMREVERPVIVARGRYKFQPIEGRAANRIEIYAENRIEIYAEKLTDPKFGGGGSGDFARMLNSVGMFIDRRIVSEVEDPPEGNLSWHYNEPRGPFTDEAFQRSRDPELVLKRLSEQTGLTFTQEPRRVRVIFVEREE